MVNSFHKKILASKIFLIALFY